jgi:hypothetical protein
MSRKYILSAIPALALIGALGYFYGGSEVPTGQAPLEKLDGQNLVDVKNAFNAAKDDVRVLLLLSPTSTACLQGASAAERILEDFPGQPVRTLVVWEPVLATDLASPATAALKRIPDLRASQYWDKQRLISHSMGEHDRHSVVWDHICVYAPGALWTDRPPRAIYEGDAVVKVVEPARAAVARALPSQGVGFNQF